MQFSSEFDVLFALAGAAADFLGCRPKAHAVKRHGEDLPESESFQERDPQEEAKFLAEEEWREGTLVDFYTMAQRKVGMRAETVERAVNDWWNLDQQRWYLTWNGKTCVLSEQQNYFLQLLAAWRGRDVEHVDLAEECWDDNCISGTTIRKFKQRLQQTLKEAEMADLAAAIVAPRKGEKIRLNLSGRPRLFFRCDGVRIE